MLSRRELIKGAALSLFAPYVPFKFEVPAIPAKTSTLTVADAYSRYIKETMKELARRIDVEIAKQYGAITAP